MKPAALVLSVAAACSGGSNGTPDAWVCPDICPDSDQQYVVDSNQLPSSAEEATRLALDIDGDGARENLLGALFAMSQDPRVDFPGSVQRGVARGETLTLLELRATGLTTAPDAGLAIYLGDDPVPVPCTSPADERTCGQHLDGNGSFDLALDSPLDQLLAGDLVGGALRAGPGRAEIRLWLGAGAPIPIRLIGARFEAQVNATSGTLTNGTIGGAIMSDEFDDVLLPAIADYIRAAVDADCAAGNVPCCAPLTAGEAFLEMLDFDGDCVLDSTELASFGGPDLLDLDLLDDTGTFNPNIDGIDDSTSFAIGFTAVGATFTAP